MNTNEPLYSPDALQYLKRTDMWLYRLAKEHILLSTLYSNVIEWEPSRVVSQFNIPDQYLVHYKLRSIVGIDEAQQPIYGEHHTLELELPPTYPLQPCKIYMKTDIWHPNIKSEGRFKGKICGNSDGFGLTYDVYQLILRIGEILQYKNYHAIHTPPFPEDSKVAEWVTTFAEPNDIVNLEKEIFTDDQALVSAPPEPGQAPEPEPEPEPELPAPPPVAPRPTIKITPVSRSGAVPPERKFTIRPKE